MYRQLMMLFVLWGLMTAPSIMAHDKSLHRGKPTDGVVMSIAADSFELKTKEGTVKVTLQPKTVFEHGAAKVDKTHLQEGGKVSVFGTKLPTGEIVAKEVLLDPPAASAGKQGAVAHEHK